MKASRIASYFKIPELSYRVWHVWRRDQDVFMKTYKVNFIPPLIEPLLYLLGLGLGLGSFVQLPEGLRYDVFIAPALVAVSMMYASFFECTYASFVRMYYQKTFDAIIATPVSLEEVIAGELLWGATKSLINSAIVLVVISLFGLVKSPFFLAILPLAFLVGLLFSAIAMCFTAITPNIDSFNYPAFLFITPMFILSGTFFPITALPMQVQTLASILFPLTHAVTLTRALTAGALNPSLLLNLAWFLVTTPFFFVLSINMMKKRLVK
ncbi:MAG TPA: ABC transporter permease [Candidatus Bathyarchaeia archaeon]|nr:ABC transporter permease [Candidatus Bathyarchaeia archaeon]